MQQQQHYMASNFILGTLEMISATLKESIQDMTDVFIRKINIILYSYFGLIVLLNMVNLLISLRQYNRQLIIDKNMLMVIPQQAYIESSHF